MVPGLFRRNRHHEARAPERTLPHRRLLHRSAVGRLAALPAHADHLHVHLLLHGAAGQRLREVLHGRLHFYPSSPGSNVDLCTASESLS